MNTLRRREVTNGIVASPMKYLYNNGDQCVAVSGGWVPYLYLTYWTTSGSTGFESNRFYIYYPSNNYLGMTHLNPVDFTPFTTLTMKILNSTANANNCVWIVYKTLNDSTLASYGRYQIDGGTNVALSGTVPTNSTTPQTITVDVSSLSGTYHVGMHGQYYNQVNKYLYGYEFYLE